MSIKRKARPGGYRAGPINVDHHNLIEVPGFGLFSPSAPRHEAIDDDQKWFEEHPDRSHRLRSMHAGEAPGIAPGSWVCIRQLEPGLRRRVGFVPDDPQALRDLVDCEVFAHALFDTLLMTMQTGRKRWPPEELCLRISMLLGQGGRA